MIADASGRAIGFALAPGQAHELPLAPLLLTLLSLVPGWIMADRGYASQAFRDLIWSLGARPAIPSKSNEAPVHCPAWIYVAGTLPGPGVHHPGIEQEPHSLRRKMLRLRAREFALVTRLDVHGPT